MKLKAVYKRMPNDVAIELVDMVKHERLSIPGNGATLDKSTWNATVAGIEPISSKAVRISIIIEK